MKRREFIYGALAAAGAAVCAGTAYALRSASASATDVEKAPEYVFTYAENQASDYPTAMGAKYFADLVYKRTNGRIKINVYTDSVSGDEPSVLEQLHYGGLDFARMSVMTMADEIPVLNVLQLPYLYNDNDHKWRVLDGEIGEEFIDSLNGTGLVGLSWYDAGSRHFYNRLRPVTCLEDLTGLRIRVAESQLMYDMVAALGATPVTVSYSDVYSALETRKVDGAENNWPSYESKGHWSISPYITLDAHNRIPEMQICSESTWSKLTDEYRLIIRKCAAESALYERKLWAQTEQEAREKIEDWCIVTELSAEELERFREATKPLYEQYAADYIDLVERIRAAAEE